MPERISRYYSALRSGNYSLVHSRGQLQRRSCGLQSMSETGH